jgi:hypothetical protein
MASPSVTCHPTQLAFHFEGEIPELRIVVVVTTEQASLGIFGGVAV